MVPEPAVPCWHFPGAWSHGPARMQLLQGSQSTTRWIPGLLQNQNKLFYKQNVQPLTGSSGDFVLCVISSCRIPQSPLSLRTVQPVRKMLRTAAPVRSPTLLPVFPSDGKMFWKNVLEKCLSCQMLFPRMEVNWVNCKSPGLFCRTGRGVGWSQAGDSSAAMAGRGTSVPEEFLQSACFL